MTGTTAPQRIQVSHASDSSIARQVAREMALAIGFEPLQCEEIVLVVSELASNLVRHAKEGTLVLFPIQDNHRSGIQIESLDRGPGIPDIELAITDGFSSTGNFGNGLGTVNRLMDEFHITSSVAPISGTSILCKRWLRLDYADENCPLEFGVASRPHLGMNLNGDAFVIKRWHQSVLVAVIDGLGHGQYAHRAARTAKDYVNRHYDQPLPELFRGVGRACRATRGVVMAIARFDWNRNHLSFANIGNIEARVIGSSTPVRFLVRRGIIGNNAPSPCITDHQWHPHYILILHSDGLTTHWEWQDFSKLTGKPASLIAQELLRSLAKENDDATVVVVKGVMR